MRHRTYILAAICGLALSTAPARAHASPDPTLPLLPFATPAGSKGADALLRKVVVIGRDYWRARGHVAPCATTRVWLINVGVYHAYSTSPGCDVLFEVAYRDEIWEMYRDRDASIWDRRAALRDLCQAGVHEAGHNAGLDHTTRDPKSPMFIVPGKHIGMPAECVRWARTKVKRSSRARDSRCPPPTRPRCPRASGCSSRAA